MLIQSWCCIGRKSYSNHVFTDLCGILVHSALIKRKISISTLKCESVQNWWSTLATYLKKNPWCCKNRDHCTTVYIIEERVLLSRCPLEGVKCIWIRNSSITPSLKAPGHVTTMKGCWESIVTYEKQRRGKVGWWPNSGKLSFFPRKNHFRPPKNAQKSFFSIPLRLTTNVQK